MSTALADVTSRADAAGLGRRRARRSPVEQLADTPAVAATVLRLPVARIAFHPDNREDLGDLTDLTRSVVDHGLDHPIVVLTAEAFTAGDDRGRQVQDHDWVVKIGHRRLAAHQAAGLEHIDAIVDDGRADTADALAAMLRENTLRKSLTLWDSVRLVGLLTDRGLSQQRIAQRSGLSKGWVSKLAAIGQLPAYAIQLVQAGELTTQVAYDLTRLEDAFLVAGVIEGREGRGETIAERLADVLSTLAVHRVLAARQADLEAAGHRVVIEPAGRGWRYGDRMLPLALIADDLGLADIVKAHERQDCHGLSLSPREPDAEPVPICLDVERHSIAVGAEAVEGLLGIARRERQRRHIARRKAAGAAVRRATPEQRARFTARASVGVLVGDDHDVAVRAASLLHVSPSDDVIEQLASLHDAHAGDAGELYFALAVARVERDLVEEAKATESEPSWDSLAGRAYLELLEQHGYDAASERRALAADRAHPERGLS